MAINFALGHLFSRRHIDGKLAHPYSIGATTVTLNTPDASTFAGTIQDGSSGNTGGRVVIDGPATLTLTGTNTYTGGTTISAGTLQLGDGTSANGSIVGDVADNGTLAFDHQANSTTTYAGVVSRTGGLDQKAGTGTERHQHLHGRDRDRRRHASSRRRRGRSTPAEGPTSRIPIRPARTIPAPPRSARPAARSTSPAPARPSRPSPATVSGIYPLTRTATRPIHHRPPLPAP